MSSPPLDLSFTTQFSMTARRCNTWPVKLGRRPCRSYATRSLPMLEGCSDSVWLEEALMGSCCSYRQFCSLGPLPPRTPARPDPQVAKDYELGPCSHGKPARSNFYADGSRDDPAFGFCEIEVSVQHM